MMNEMKYAQNNGQDIGPQRLDFQSIEPEGDHYAGIAILKNTSGPGEFQIKVSGPKSEIEQYEEMATFHEISLTQIDNGTPLNPMEIKKGPDRETWQDWIEQHCKALKDLVEGMDDSALADHGDLGQLLQQKAQESMASIYLPDSPIDLTRDRSIEIRPTSLEQRGRYELRFRIDPVLKQGLSDYYKPSFAMGDTASANISTISGDPDLYLYRGWKRVDVSLRAAGFNESVQASGGSGDWLVKVYGYSTAQYEISSSWTFWS